MKKTLVFTLAAAAMIGTSAFAAEQPQVQAYAHPTLFGSEAQIEVGANSNSVIGGKIYKGDNAKTIKGKEDVVISTFAKNELAKFAAYSGNSNYKTPVLRRELAQTMADCLSLSTVKNADKYSEVSATYWAKTAIDEALAAGVMIGYHDQTFKPEQRVTKAEVFCTLAKVFNVSYDKTSTPTYKGKEIKFIPSWASNATNEVLATGILKSVPDENALINNEYLTKEQATYLVGALSEYIKAHPYVANSNLKAAGVAVDTALIQMDERVSARTANAGAQFTARLAKSATIKGVTYAEGTKVKGVVSEVVRPGVKNPGFIAVKFTEIANGNGYTKLPEIVSSATVKTAKDANVVARVLGAPFSTSARVAGVAGRTISQEATLTSNSAEHFGDNLSNAFTNAASLQPVAGLTSFGKTFVTTGKFVLNSVENVAGGVFGCGCELVDKIHYVFAPKYSNKSSLNPKEVLKVSFE